MSRSASTQNFQALLETFGDHGPTDIHVTWLKVSPTLSSPKALSNSTAPTAPVCRLRSNWRETSNVSHRFCSPSPFSPPSSHGKQPPHICCISEPSLTSSRLQNIQRVSSLLRTCGIQTRSRFTRMLLRQTAGLRVERWGVTH